MESDTQSEVLETQEPNFDALDDNELNALINSNPESDNTPSSKSPEASKDARPKEELAKEPHPEIKAEPPQKPQEQSDEQITVSKKDYERLSKQVRDKERFIQQQRSEIGSLRTTRQQLEQRYAELQQGLEQKALENPVQAIDDRLEMREIERAAQLTDQQEAEHYARLLVETHVGQSETMIDDMLEVLQSDGLPEQFLRQFAQNPYVAAHPETVIQLSKRAALNRSLKEKDSLIQELQTKLKDAESKPQQVLQKIQGALKKSPPVSASSGQSISKPAVSETQLDTLSDAELNELIKEGNLI